MSDLFKGLEGLGFADVKSDDLFSENKSVQKGGEKPELDAAKLEQVVVQRKYECPVCEKDFTNHFLRSSKLRLIRSDSDLRPYYDPLDPLYYDVIMCPHCGYAAMSGVFRNITEKQTDLIKENITPKFKKKDYPALYTADHAIERYTLALLNSYVKGSKNSEKAFLCLKLAWLYRDKNDEENELKFLKSALAGFKSSYQKEGFPIFNMDENTMTYLLGELSRRSGDFDEALRYISRVVVERNISPRLKSRAEDVKELIREDKKRLGLQ